MQTKLSKTQLSDLQTWYTVNNRIISFENKFNMYISQELFGSEEGERLFLHFRKDCSTTNPYKDYITYLTTDQYNLLLEEIMISPKYN